MKRNCNTTKTHSLFEVLKRVIARNSKERVDELRWDEWQDGTKTLEFDPFVEIPIADSQWVLKDTTDDEARIILRDFIGNKTLCGWSLNCQMARLLSEKGQLVAKRMDKLIEMNDWSNGKHTLLLAYLAVKPDGAAWANKLLDSVSFFRDGLFLACWKIRDKRLQAKLLRKFEEWFTEDEAWGSGTGEDGWLGRFISKWLTEGTFAYERLEKCIRWYFKHTAL